MMITSVSVSDTVETETGAELFDLLELMELCTTFF